MKTLEDVIGEILKMEKYLDAVLASHAAVIKIHDEQFKDITKMLEQFNTSMAPVTKFGDMILSREGGPS